MNSLTQEQVREHFDYDPETGLLYHRRLQKYSGSKTGDGYLSVKIAGNNHKVHRVVWLWMTGDIPKGYVRHKNGNLSDNRWGNLHETIYQ